MISVDFSMFIDKPHVARRLSKYKKAVLGGTGAFAKTAMKRQIRPKAKGKRARTVTVDGVACLVPIHGMVVDAKTQRPVAKQLAAKARLAMRAKTKAEDAGKPPRRGPTDLLRKHIYFGVEPDSETVVVGPMMFSSQPKLSGVVSVPQLLEEGGREHTIAGLVKYSPRPFVAPTMPTAQKKFAELTESTPLY